MTARARVCVCCFGKQRPRCATCGASPVYCAHAGDHYQVRVEETDIANTKQVHYDCSTGAIRVMMGVAVAVFIAGLLLACGDVEANPGPLETAVTGDNAVEQSVGTEEQTSQHSDQPEGQSVFARYYSEMTQALIQAVIRLESASRHRAGEHHRRTTPECRRQNRAPSTASGRGTGATR